MGDFLMRGPDHTEFTVQDGEVCPFKTSSPY